MTRQLDGRENDLVFFRRHGQVVRPYLDASPGHLRGLNPTPKVVFVIGNWAIEGGDDALKSFTDSEILMPFIKRDGERDLEKIENFKRIGPIRGLATLSYIYKAQISAAYRQLERGKLDAMEEMIYLIRWIRDVRVRLAGHFEKLSTKLSLRKLSSGNFDLLHREDTGVVTINWDEVLWKDQGIKNCIGIHGRCIAPGSMILPTELTSDFRVFDAICETSSPERMQKLKCLTEVIGADGRNGCAGMLDQAHGIANDWLVGAEKIIFWGVSLETYDNELYTLLSMVANERKESIPKIACINKTPHHREMAAYILGMKDFEIIEPA